MEHQLSCPKECCKLSVGPYTGSFKFVRNGNGKAGVFIYDPDAKKILLVQSRGNLWGPPKGSMNDGENELECAVREVMEETGIDVDKNKFTNETKIKHNAKYFYLEMKECDVKIQNHIKDNDANGIGWIGVDCLGELIRDGKIFLSKHCRIVVRNFLGINLPLENEV